MFGWKGQVLRVDLTSETITKEKTKNYVPKFIGGRGIIAKVLWDEVPPEVKAFDPENRIIFATGPLTGTNTPSNGRWRIGSLAPQHPKEYPSHSGIGGHWGAELKFAGYDAVIVQGKAKKPSYIFIYDDKVEIRSASKIWGVDAIKSQKMIQEDLANDKSLTGQEKPQAGRYNPQLVRTVLIGQAGENQTRVSSILHDSGDAAGQCGFGGVMGSKNLKAIAVRGTGSVPVAKPKDLVESVFKARKMLRAQAKPVVPAYGGPGGIYGGDPKILTSHMKRLDGCFGCQVICRAYIAPPGITAGQAQCVQLQMYYNWEGVGPVCPPHPDFLNRPQDETTWYGVKLADEYTINSFELTGFLSYLWAAYKAGILNEENTGGIPFKDFGSKEFADKLFSMIAKREGFRNEFGDLLAEGMHRAALQLKEKYGDKAWQLYEERYTAHGMRQHWFYIGSAKGPGDQTGYPNPIGQLLWATDTRDPYSNTSRNRETYGSQDLCQYLYGTKDAANPFSYAGKAQAAVVSQHRAVLIDSVSACDWFFPIQTNNPLFKEEAGIKAEGTGWKEAEAEFYSLVTGINTTLDGLFTDSERIFNIERAAQVIRGRTREEDTFNEYYFTHKDRRNNAIDRSAWEKAKDDYYQLRGWDLKTGIPTRERLESLDLKDVANKLNV
ncbi:MAG: hypothetical protein M1503_01315 [Thaumarchaeota archaeon]|nr:hypothetical protein [Nitrososphaerota archaeon]MCL5316894.1 hypothetical protein [Nitrososphaerota archaeon]